MTYYLIIDESGEKGYSTNINTSNNEFGVMAGYFLSIDEIDKAREILKAELNTIDNNKKVHITDLTKDKQVLLRNTIFKLFKSNKTRWIHQSIYNKGFCNSTIGNKSLLHAELFLGIFLKAIAHIYDKFRNKEIHLNIISDTIDKTTKEKLKKSVKDVISILTGDYNKINVSKKWNSEKKELTNWKTVSTVVVDPNSLQLNKLTFDINCENSELTLAADVLANSTYYYLKEKTNVNNSIRLDSKEAISNHPLSNQLYGYYDKSDNNAIDLFNTIYRKDYNQTQEKNK